MIVSMQRIILGILHLVFLQAEPLHSFGTIPTAPFVHTPQRSSIRSSRISITATKPSTRRRRRMPSCSTTANSSIVSSTASNNNNSELENNIQNQIRILGITGGIGSGKSTICKLLVSELHCIAHIDADSIAHSVYQPGSPVVAEIAQAFGADKVLKKANRNEIDRPKLGSIVFADRQAMKQLERIVWPHVEAEITRQIATIILREQQQQQQQPPPPAAAEKVDREIPVIVVEAAVMLDAGWHDSFLDAVWAVVASEDVAVQRLMENRDLSREDALKRIHAQESRRGIGNIDQEVQNKVVTATIDNNGSLDSLKKVLSEKLADDTAWYGTSRKRN